MRGVTGSDSTDAAEVPTLLVAVTVKVYAVPFVSPVTAHDNTPAVEHDPPPGDDVTVYPVIAAPPSLAGADHDTDT